MRRLFVETSFFAARVDKAGREALSEIQNELLRRLESGAVIEGTGGLRKLRIADRGRGKGKRGGFRAIYLDVPKAGKTYLVALYDKDEKGDLTADDKKVLARWVNELKKEAK